MIGKFGTPWDSLDMGLRACSVIVGNRFQILLPRNRLRHMEGNFGFLPDEGPIKCVGLRDTNCWGMRIKLFEGVSFWHRANHALHGDRESCETSKRNELRLRRILAIVYIK